MKRWRRWRRPEANVARLQLAGLVAVLLWQRRLWRRDLSRLRRLRAQRAPWRPPSHTPRVSILLPAWNEAENVGAAIRSILALRYPNKELIVCAGGADGTFARARRHAGEGVIVLPQEAGDGKQGALRHSFARATGEIIFLTDADCLLDDEAFERTLQPIVDEGEGAVAGIWRPHPGQVKHPFVRYQWAHHVYRALNLPAYPAALDGRNAAVRRELVERSGGFQVDAPTGTDYVLSRQLAVLDHKIRLARASQVVTCYPESVRAYWKQQSRWFRNPLLLGWQWGQQRLALGALWAGVTSLLLLLALPLCLLAGSRSGWAGLATAVLHLWLSACRVLRVLGLVEGEPQSRFDYLRLLLYLPIGWVALARGLGHSVRIADRRRW